jgi:GNAT superfamily N-acetyltransferase
MQRIEPLASPVTDSDLRDLARLLVDAVESGASVSFLAPLAPEQAEDWWRGVLCPGHAGAVVLVARDGEGIVGSVQLRPAWEPNQAHRAEVAKLLVHRRGRRRGLGTLLMRAVEETARARGFSLLTLDTKQGDAAERLYRRTGWTCVGVIPGYALNPDGTACDTVVFYKQIGPRERGRG